MAKWLFRLRAIIGNDAAIAFGGTFGAFELNTMLPVIAYNLLLSIELLTSAAASSLNVVSWFGADVQNCESNVEKSLAMCTALAPVIGYDKAARIAKIAYESGEPSSGRRGGIWPGPGSAPTLLDSKPN